MAKPEPMSNFIIRKHGQELDRIVTEVQTDIYAVRELAEAIREASDEIEPTEKEIRLQGRIEAFGHLIVDRSNNIARLAEAAEHLSLKLRQGSALAPLRSAWEEKLAAFRSAREAQEAQHAAEVAPLARAHDEAVEKHGRESAPARAVFDAIAAPERRFDAMVDKTSEALRAMVRTPVPDLNALAIKIGTMIAEDAFNADDVNDLAEDLLHDVWRLDGVVAPLDVAA